MSDGPLWFVIYCENDDSFVLLGEKSVLYDDDTVQVGDKVNFKYPGVKDLLVGKIKGFSIDYDGMKKLQDKLNADTKPKRNASFHEGSKRKAKERCIQGLKLLSTHPSCSGTSGKQKGRDHGKGSSSETSAHTPNNLNENKSGPAKKGNRSTTTKEH